MSNMIDDQSRDYSIGIWILICYVCVVRNHVRFCIPNIAYVAHETPHSNIVIT